MTQRKDHVFGTSLSCMDGRVQDPIQKWIKEKFNLEHVDTITQPGIDGILGGGLAGNIGNVLSVKLARHMTSISVNAHGSSVIVVSGHHDCAGNPVSKEQHIKDIKIGVMTVKSWYETSDVTVVGIWVNENWEVEEVV